MCARVTFMERVKAAAIVKKLRDQYNRPAVAKMLDLQETYVTTAEHKTKRKVPNGEDFACPPHAIKKILAFTSKISTQSVHLP